MSFFNRKSQPDSLEDSSSSADQKLLSQLTNKKWPNLAQVRALPNLLSATERLTIKILSLIGVAAIAGLILAFYFSHALLVPKVGGQYTEGLIGGPQYLNPLLLAGNEVDQDLTPLIFDGLFKTNNNGASDPNLAESFQVSPDNKVYTIQLRKNALWHDGKKFTADDVLFTTEAIQGSDWITPLKNLLKGMAFEKINDYAIKITLTEAQANLTNNLTFGILPQHLWLTINPASLLLTELNRKPIGTGPFQFKSLTKDKNGAIRNIVLARNPNYHLTPAYLTELTFKFYPDWETAVTALKNQNVEGLSLVPADWQKEVENNKNVRLYSLSLPQYTAIFFNGKKNALLQDKKFRQALAQAVDRQQIVDQTLAGKGLIINTPILPNNSGYNPNLSTYSFSIDNAAQTLATLGWTKNDQGLLAKNKTVAELTLTTNDKPEYKQTAEIIKDSWQKLGLKVNLQIIPKDQIFNTVISPRNYEMLLFGEMIKSDPMPFWHSSFSKDPGRNLTSWQNKEADGLLEKIHDNPNDPGNGPRYQRFQELIAEEMPAIFLYNPIQLYPLSQRIQGFTTRRILTNSDRLSRLTDWYIQTSRKFSWTKPN
ncbi:MAG: ABC transporter substrate-binding protein [Candidatus Komeilibacteria bacterium]|nr:ABC transporter substrate-binding protein [Candidatus Komeilibacteria bacterium]